MNIAGIPIIIIVVWLAYRLAVTLFGGQDAADRNRWQPPRL